MDYDLAVDNVIYPLTLEPFHDLTVLPSIKLGLNEKQLLHKRLSRVGRGEGEGKEKRKLFFVRSLTP
jgi:hypothetical protein